MRLPEIIEVIALTMGIQPADLPEIEVVVVPQGQMRRHCAAEVTDACFVGENGIGKVYLTRKHQNDYVLIAHEMTHAIQYELGRFGAYACARESEREAYEISNEIARRLARVSGKRAGGMGEVRPAEIEKAARC